MIRNSRTVLLSAVVLLLAGALRLWAGLDDLWLDEIWTWVLIQGRVKSAWDVLLSLKHENNHFLNTWWMYLLGPDTDRLWYRLPAVVLGSLTVLLARHAVADSGQVAVRAVTVLTLPSYLLVHYSSEARGYAYQLFFSLAAYVLLERLLRWDWPPFNSAKASSRHGLIYRVLFGASCLLGCLGHPAFLMMFLALGGWAVWATFRSAKHWSAAIHWLFRVFFIPTALLTLLWFVNLSQLVNGGGPQENPWLVAVSTLSLMVGGPEYGDASLFIGLMAAVAVTVELVLRRRAGDDRWVCWLLMVLVPAALIAVTGRREVYPRYFLGTVVLFDLALAHLAARCVVKGLPGRIAVIVLLAGTLIGNGWQLAQLYRFGRGHAQSVVEYLRDESGPGPILIGSDQRFRHDLLLGYFGYRLGNGNRIIHLGEGPWPPQGPQWILMHSLDATWNPDPVYIDIQGNRYELRRVFPSAGLSGWKTAVYENAKDERREAGK